MSPLALSLHFLKAQPDSRLIALAREGHEPAFEALVRRYRSELLAYCRRMQPRSGSAEDALQQTLLQAWKALQAGAEVREARPWLYRIAHNVTLNHQRVMVAVPQQVPEAAGGLEVHQVVEQRLQARAALAGMASLPALQRDVFISTTLNGASHEEVASALGLSSGAVRGLIYRARATLRSAAAALTPSPVVNWAMRRADSRPGATRALGETLAGGGGAGVVAAIAKGGAVLGLAGAVAGAGSVIITQTTSHHHHSQARLAAAPAHEQAHLGPAGVRLMGDKPASLVPGASRSVSGNLSGEGGPRAGVGPARGLGLVGEEQGVGRGAVTGDDGGHSGGSDGGSSTGLSGGSGGGSDPGATTSTESSSGSGSSGGSDGALTGSSGGSDGVTIGSSDGGTSGSSDGGTSGGSDSGSSTASDGGSTSGLTGTSDGGSTSGSDGGSSTGSSSGSTSTTSGSDGGSSSGSLAPSSVTTSTDGGDGGSGGGSTSGS